MSLHAPASAPGKQQGQCSSFVAPCLGCGTRERETLVDLPPTTGDCTAEKSSLLHIAHFARSPAITDLSGLYVEHENQQAAAWCRMPETDRERMLQKCILGAQPIKQQEYQKLLNASDTFQTISAGLPRIRKVSECGFVDRAFRAIVDNDCDPVRNDMARMIVAALLSALGIMLASLYFCICFRCAFHAAAHL
jgi:hypothetical protein